MCHEYELVTPFNISLSSDNGYVYHMYIKSFTILTAEGIASKCTPSTFLLLIQHNNTFTFLVVMSHSQNTLSFWSGKIPHYIKIKKHYNIILEYQPKQILVLACYGTLCGTHATFQQLLCSKYSQYGYLIIFCRMFLITKSNLSIFSHGNPSFTFLKIERSVSSLWLPSVCPNHFHSAVITKKSL